TTKSILPHFSLSASKAASIVAGSVTSQWPSKRPPSSLASGSTRFFTASPCPVKAIFAAAAPQALAIRHPIAQLVATPRTTTRLPCIKLKFCPIRAPTELKSDFGGTPALHHGTAPIGQSLRLFTANPNVWNSRVVQVLY